MRLMMIRVQCETKQRVHSVTRNKAEYDQSQGAV